MLTYSKTDEALALTGSKKRAVEESVADFRQHGADLPSEKKKRLEEIDAELSQVTQKFSENLLDSTNAWELVIDDASRLTGLPQGAVDAARADAQARELGTPDAPRYRLTLKAPSLIPVMDHLDDDSILASARSVDSRLAAGESLSPLAGIPVAVKDNICVKGRPATAGSRSHLRAASSSSSPRTRRCSACSASSRSAG